MVNKMFFPLIQKKEMDHETSTIPTIVLVVDLHFFWGESTHTSMWRVSQELLYSSFADFTWNCALRVA